MEVAIKTTHTKKTLDDDEWAQKEKENGGRKERREDGRERSQEKKTSYAKRVEIQKHETREKKSNDKDACYDDLLNNVLESLANAIRQEKKHKNWEFRWLPLSWMIWSPYIEYQRTLKLMIEFRKVVDTRSVNKISIFPRHF